MRRLALLTILALTGLLLVVPPAAACACGAVVTQEGVRVNEETALIRHDGQTEEIVMGLTMTDEPRDAAWILPVPADPSFELGPEDLFADLAVLTRPRTVVVRDWFPPWGRGGATAGSAPGDGATVLDQITIGPYDVTTLAATDGDALANWLNGHGYRLDPALAGGFAPYAAAGWRYVAVKLTAPDDRERLSRQLPPLRVSFASAEIVYPMRLTALARDAQSVRLYVLTDHRVRSAGPVGPTDSHVRFAGWIGPEAVAGTTLAGLVDGRRFLTRFDQRIESPESITDDYRFVAAGADDDHRDVVYRTEPVYLAGLPAGPFLIILGVLLTFIVAGTVTAVLMRRRTR
ncbi:DUF2330 domain-containing protein [Polymorphospora lycopeni]|uniref:DUF2330 domain-containing protein n=1 Tax=Polymorphospora lycopeni TaxID=3140240 RepID=A0ABV5CT09_9ACTN